MIQEHERSDDEILEMKSDLATIMINNGFNHKMKMVCDTCSLKRRCEFAYDMETLFGSCMLSKMGIDDISE